jgi:hypothetical protein
MDLKTEIEIANVVVATIGAVIVASFWNWVNHKLEQYRYLDGAYNEILKAYLDQPRFGQPKLTGNYAVAFKDEELWEYHYFAMRVHTFLETTFDCSKVPLLHFWWIPIVWKQIFHHHTQLHSAWLRDHRDLHEPRYLQRVLGKESA